MIQLQDIHSLSEFQRNTKEHIKRLKKTGRPEVLTVNGKAQVVVQDAKSYQKLLDSIERAEAIDGIREGLEDVKAGRVQSMDDFFEGMRRKYKIPEEA